MKILNLTQHVATPDQIGGGVIEPTDAVKAAIKRLLTFTELPTKRELNRRAEQLIELFYDVVLGDTSNCADKEMAGVMIGGAPFFMSSLEREFKKRGFRVFHAFSQRESMETTLSDGSVEKKMVFKHAGFIEV